MVHPHPFFRLASILCGWSAAVLILLHVPTANAQLSDSGDGISLTVVTPESYVGLNGGQLSSLRGKIIHMVTSHGLSGDGSNADLVIYPVLDIYNRQTVEGLRNLTVVQGDLNLYVKNMGQDLVFASLSMPIQGNGTSESQAITNAIRSVKSSGRDASDFFDTARQRIIDYYETECDNLLERARALTRAQLFDQAFGLTMSIPPAVPSCYRDAQIAVELVFEAYQSQNCGEQVQAARAAAANNSYSNALSLLANVDPTSSCDAEATRLAREISREVDARERRYYEAAREAFRTAARLTSEKIQAAAGIQKKRLEAARDVARAYTKYRASNVRYATVVSTTPIH